VFVYELDIQTFSELWFFLFRKKQCPKCGRKLCRVTFPPDLSSGWEQDGLNIEYVYKTKEAIRYRCDPCHSYYSLAEIARKA
jgi:hypothetical protein